jgi:hypothetical protein
MPETPETFLDELRDPDLRAERDGRRRECARQLKAEQAQRLSEAPALPWDFSAAGPILTMFQGGLRLDEVLALRKQGESPTVSFSSARVKGRRRSLPIHSFF